MSIKNVPQMPEKSKAFTNDSWSALEKRIRQILLTNCIEEQINWKIGVESKLALKSIGNLVVVRGHDAQKY